MKRVPRFAELKNQLLTLKVRWNKPIVPLLIFSVVCSLVWMARGSDQAVSSEAGSETWSVDTVIPAGFVLIPIEIGNSESLSHILGDTGVVDLFATDSPNKRPVASRIKVVRSPVNPDYLSVLVPENEAGQVLAHPGPFYVAVQNPRQSGARVHSEKARPRGRIHVEVQ